MTCTADLSQGRAAWLGVADFAASQDPGATVCHRPTYQPPARPAVKPRPTLGRGCGDVVLELPATGLATYSRRGGLLDVFVIQRPAGTRPGDRVYLARDRAITGYLRIERVEPLPNGVFLRCSPHEQTVARPIPVEGRCEQHHWRWRFFERELPEQGSDDQIAAAVAAYDRDTFEPDYPWTRRIPARRHDLTTAPAGH